ncbi:histidine phosphatase family protein [Bacillus sp. AK128]
MVKIGIIRHGQTQWNQEGRAQGSADIPLNEEGLKGAQLLANRLKGEGWDYIYSSDLVRAEQTAALIQKELRIPLRIDSRLREVAGGLIEGTTEEERVSEWGTNWRKQDLGIEKDESIIDRGQLFIQDMVERHNGGRILLVSHGAFLYKLLRELIHDSVLVRLHNTSYSIINKEENKWTCKQLNCTRHLE